MKPKAKMTMAELVGSQIEIWNGKEYTPATVEKVQFPGVAVSFRNSDGKKEKGVIAALALRYLKIERAKSAAKSDKKTRKVGK
jgi:hypothetical protein